MREEIRVTFLEYVEEVDQGGRDMGTVEMSKGGGR